ncbi:MarR family transcriptional regulator [Arthrobacter sp. H5]|uniref:MarR family winged helix-turn-helix transcriptional regulator n=1 Tax=Arthrobacter sp. H5 TaxID=1267973 RepID=UPI000489A959|nr:MarR family transcriptional regulator [Arthrobacter sp. H5]
MTAVKWLSPAERQAWLALYAVATMLPGTLDAQLNKRAKITLFDYHVLAMLSEAEGHTLPMSELAGRSNASLSRLSHVVTKLEDRSWVRRSQSNKDARVTTATITADGLQNLRVLAEGHVQHVRSVVFDALDAEDVADLERIGRKILSRMDEQHWILRQALPL